MINKITGSFHVYAVPSKHSVPAISFKTTSQFDAKLNLAYDSEQDSEVKLLIKLSVIDSLIKQTASWKGLNITNSFGDLILDHTIVTVVHSYFNAQGNTEQKSVTFELQNLDDLKQLYAFLQTKNKTNTSTHTNKSEIIDLSQVLTTQPRSKITAVTGTFDVTGNCNQAIDYLGKDFSESFKIAMNIDLMANPDSSYPAQELLELYDALVLTNTLLTNFQTAFFAWTNMKLTIAANTRAQIAHQNCNEYQAFFTDNFFGLTSFAGAYTSRIKASPTVNDVLVSTTVDCHTPLLRFSSANESESKQNKRADNPAAETEVSCSALRQMLGW